jgi:hypothetical protein
LNKLYLRIADNRNIIKETGFSIRSAKVSLIKGYTVKPLYKDGLGTPGVILIEEVSL